MLAPRGLPQSQPIWRKAWNPRPSGSQWDIQGMNCQRRKDQTSKYEVLRPGNRRSCRIVSHVSTYTLHQTTGTSFIQRKKGLAPCFLTNLAIVNLSTLLYGDLAMVKASPRTVYSEPGSGSMPASGRMVTCSIYFNTWRPEASTVYGMVELALLFRF